MTDPRAHIRAVIENAPVVAGEAAPAAPIDDEAGHDDGLPPSDMTLANVDPHVVRRCAALDLSDTDNGQRLIAHFGQDLTIVARDGAAGGDWLFWSGKCWDRDGGAAGAVRTAQQVGGRIALEAAELAKTPAEAAAINAAEAFAEGDESEPAKRARMNAKISEDALKARKRARWKFAVTSKNSARIKSMLDMSAPHMRRAAGEFNADPMRLVTQTHTLEFVVEDDPECPDPDIRRKKARVEADPAFTRAHLVTGLAQCDYDAAAASPKWQRFLDETMPDLELRRTLQAYSGMGLLGVLAQRLMFHYGSGANGKSVFLAVMLGVIGPSLSVGLPKETLMGQGERGAGQASPDLVRLFGKRCVRIDELKEGEVLREDLVKRLTGGDPMVVRDMYSGYLEFPNVATPHMSGNGFPRIDGTDNGIWRRMLVVHWKVTIPLEQRRDFDEIVADLLTERAGILNWLIAGAIDFLENGLFVAPACIAATAEYREEMDPVGEFCSKCVTTSPGDNVQASVMFSAFTAWAKANGRAEFSSARVGRNLKNHVKRSDKSTARFYLDVRLTDEVKALMSGGAPPAPEDWDE